MGRFVVAIADVFITLTERAPTISINTKTLNAVANLVRGLLDRETN